ncbi:phosphoribosylglycinamide synthetase [Fusarium tricinctum]|uniref:phosphoribosylamine--glycine ligase n=1 Tax=Fusarium tricinctum TaxID=61284 RepID=A0A8K0RTF5_9HYPO|nr:phosphoribosylglycinamide synthetase [Fusarium tricinctum]
MNTTLHVLVIGKGGREHALAWKLSHGRSVQQVFVFPGNAGTQNIEAKDNTVAVSNITQEISNNHELAQHAKELGVGLVVVGPGDDVVNGIEEYFREVGIPCFAPSRKAAELEGSKVLAKEFMEKWGIPTANYISTASLPAAQAYVRCMFTDNNHRVVIKANGLAAGKGVMLPETKEQALDDLSSIMGDGKFSTPGTPVVVEEHMRGYEVSILTFSDGKTFFSLPPGHNHKRALESNMGLNTRGMGIYSPVRMVTQEVFRQIDNCILKPTFDAMGKEGRPFQGLLFTTVMVTDHGPKVIGYNVRFGDPEAQTSMLLMDEDTDLANILLSCTNGTLEQTEDTIKIKPGFACNVVIASGGYPVKHETGKTVTLKTPPEGVVIFHAGTRSDEKDGSLKTAGGRVFSVAAYAGTLEEARSKAYLGVGCVSFEPMAYRKDIAIGAVPGRPSWW